MCVCVVGGFFTLNGIRDRVRYLAQGGRSGKFGTFSHSVLVTRWKRESHYFFSRNGGWAERKGATEKSDAGRRKKNTKANDQVPFVGFCLEPKMICNEFD